MFMSNLPKILICDDDAIFHVCIKHMLKGQFDCKSAVNGDEALAIIKYQAIDILLLDVHLRSSEEGLHYIPKLLSVDPDLSIVMSSASTDFRTVKEAMRLGATDYVAKSFVAEELTHSLYQILERRALLRRKHQQNYETLTAQKRHLLVGESSQVQGLRKNIEKIRNSLANVVITGETGTGKEVVARLLRKTLPDGSLAPFIAVDSATIQSTMAESILFGHEKGAFTGAEKITKGIFEEAHEGTVYFDEISNMPLTIQSKLLRVIQEKEITRLGSSKVIKLNFRVICATNKDLDRMVKAGEFKDDLLQRLNVIPLHLPTLQERIEDIPLLVNHFVEKQASSCKPLRFTEEAIQVLRSYSWPGNVRELENLIAYLSTMVEGNEIEPADLPPKFREAARAAATQTLEKNPETDSPSFYQKVSKFESKLLSDAYRQHQGNISQLALTLGMDRSHLYMKLKEFGIHHVRKPSKPTGKALPELVE
jgi:DNA-binding NtrC family response regulator